MLLSFTPVRACVRARVRRGEHMHTIIVYVALPTREFQIQIHTIDECIHIHDINMICTYRYIKRTYTHTHTHTHTHIHTVYTQAIIRANWPVTAIHC
jgi:hypothetical protein